jgi:hypothetical protein
VPSLILKNINLTPNKSKVKLQNIKLDLIYEEILLYHFEDFKKEYLGKIKNNESNC